jgi:hypothetical protein
MNGTHPGLDGIFFFGSAAIAVAMALPELDIRLP